MTERKPRRYWFNDNELPFGEPKPEFDSLEAAEAYIAEKGASGVLTAQSIHGPGVVCVAVYDEGRVLDT